MIVFYLKIFDRFITIYHGWTATNEINQPYNVYIMYIFSITIRLPSLCPWLYFLVLFPTSFDYLFPSSISFTCLTSSSVVCVLFLGSASVPLFIVSVLSPVVLVPMFPVLDFCLYVLVFGFILNWMTLFLPGLLSHLFAILCLPTYSESYFLLAYLHSKLNLDSNV